VDKVILRHGYISIPNYTMGDCSWLENSLSVYDEVYHKLIPVGYYYDEEKEELRVPAGLGVNSVARALHREADVDYKCDEARKAIFTLNIEPRDLTQKRMVSFLAGVGEYHMNSKYSQVAVIGGTGVGKTYCSIAALSFLRMVTMIIVNSDHLRSHWKDKIVEYTGADKAFIKTISGSAAIDRLTNSKKAHREKAYIITHSTLESYANNHGWDSIGEFFANLGIGCVIIDEAHRCFGNTVKVLTHINSKKILMLTATFKRSAYKEDKIFQACFNNIPKYVQGEREGEEESQRHITGLMVLYESRPSMAVEEGLSTIKGLSKTKYADFLVDRDIKFYEVFGRYADYFINKMGARTLVVSGSINSCDALAKYLGETCKGKMVGVYHSKISAKDKENVRENADVIVTTYSSLGEGTDLDNLHAVINLEAYSSDIETVQCPGRLRNLNDGKPYYYMEIVNVGIRRAENQYKKRKKTFKKNFGAIKIFDHRKG